MDLLPDKQNCGLRMRRECQEGFPHHPLQRKPLVSDPGMHHGTRVLHVPWCMPGSLTRGGGEKHPGISGACATRNFAYLVRSPLIGHQGRPTPVVTRHANVMYWCCYFTLAIRSCSSTLELTSKIKHRYGFSSPSNHCKKYFFHLLSNSWCLCVSLALRNLILTDVFRRFPEINIPVRLLSHLNHYRFETRICVLELGRYRPKASFLSLALT